LLSWLKEQDSSRRAFCFDLIMSATYLDATSGLEKNIEACSNTPADYNAHLGFINLCSPCYSICGKWSYQKAAKTYYLANASGNPPKVASEKNSWPKLASISDSKTSAGMDRTDDIKKGIYQSLKIGTQLKSNPEFKTALISNLPAYRHGKEYVVPFINMYWGLEEDIKNIEGTQAIMLEDLRRVFDFIITLEEPILRDINL